MSYLCCADVAESVVSGALSAAPLVDPHLASLSLIQGLAPFDSPAQLNRQNGLKATQKCHPGFSDFRARP